MSGLLWPQAGPAILAAFLASLVEFVEALTIVLAVGTVRGWRSALLGAAAGAAILAALIAAFGPALQHVPLFALQLAVGLLLLLFGLRWLRKAVLRAAGIIALHDEEAAFASETAALRAGMAGWRGWDWLAIATACKAVVIEGLEVVFAVVAIGALGNMLMPASIGAAVALAVVVLLGLALHRPLALVPENALKLAVGVMLSAFGVFWLGEGMGLVWPQQDLSVLGLIVAFLAAAMLCAALARRLAQAPAVPRLVGCSLARTGRPVRRRQHAGLGSDPVGRCHRPAAAAGAGQRAMGRRGPAGRHRRDSGRKYRANGDAATLGLSVKTAGLQPVPPSARLVRCRTSLHAGPAAAICGLCMTG
jgi:Ca2+/H+ antiporter, TMEM165/GDT1 family